MGVLDGKIVLVTGASRGIGRAIALTLGAAGAVVVGTATTEAGAAGIQQAFDEAGVKGRGTVLDVTDTAGVAAVLAAIEKDFGAVSVLVNNAGITRDNLAMRMKDDEWQAVIDTNLKAVFTLSRAVMKGMMKARNGRIINITSVVGETGNPGQANYAAAKAGVVGFSKSLAQEVAARGVTVNAVAPGMIDTDMTRALTDAQRAAMLTRIPAARLGAAEEIAAAVAFLVSEQAAYITGETLHVNGGMHMA